MFHILVLVWKAVYCGLVLRHRFKETRPYALLGRYHFFFFFALAEVAFGCLCARHPAKCCYRCDEVGTV